MRDIFKFVAALVAIALVCLTLQFADRTVAPLFLDSRVERLGERNLPTIVVERGGVVYCRMKADDFRFPLPLRSRATNLVVAGGFDTVDGSVEARFEGTRGMTVDEYQDSLTGKVSAGGWVTAQSIAGGLLIKFHYFGDR
jgi:hypothetical protein